MPAISLLKLNEGIQHIKSLIDKPVDLVQYIEAFFETYSDQTFHPGDKSAMDPRLPFYKVPNVITRKLEQEFEKLSSESPEKTWPIIDLLWKDRHYESRYLACSILGNLPNDHFAQVLEKFDALLLHGVEPFFLEALFSLGTQTIRVESPQLWCEHAKAWLNNDSIRWKSYGLLAYKVILQEGEYKDLPLIMQYLLPFFKDPHPLLINEAIYLFQQLLQSFPDEIDFYIEDILNSPKNPAKELLLRKVLSQYSPAKYQLFRSRLQESE